MWPLLSNCWSLRPTMMHSEFGSLLLLLLRRICELAGGSAWRSTSKSGQLCSSDFFYRSQRWSFSYSGSRSIDSGHARRHTKISIALLGVARAGYQFQSKFQWPRGQPLARRVRPLPIAIRAADTSLAEKRAKTQAGLAAVRH